MSESLSVISFEVDAPPRTVSLTGRNPAQPAVGPNRSIMAGTCRCDGLSSKDVDAQVVGLCIDRHGV